MIFTKQEYLQLSFSQNWYLQLSSTSIKIDRITQMFFLNAWYTEKETLVNYFY